jgi:hypothetical protein
MTTTTITVFGRCTDPCTDHVAATRGLLQVSPLEIGINGTDCEQLSVWR